MLCIFTNKLLNSRLINEAHRQNTGAQIFDTLSGGKAWAWESDTMEKYCIFVQGKNNLKKKILQLH